MLCLFALLCAARAQCAKVDSGYPEPGVRPQGMGGAFVAVADDVNSIFYNPAGLALIKNRQVQITHTDLYGLGIDYNYLAYAQAKFGVAWAHYGVSSDFLLGGGDFSNDMLVFAGVYPIDKQTFVGANFKLLKSQFTAPGTTGTFVDGNGATQNVTQESLGDQGISVDIGVLHQVDSVTTVGARVKDLYGYRKTTNTLQSVSNDKFKPQISVGFARKTSQDFLFAVELQGVGKETIVHIGAEKKMQDQLTLRAGLDDDVFTAGLSFAQDAWQFDYSYKNQVNTGLDKTQRFGATIRF